MKFLRILTNVLFCFAIIVFITLIQIGLFDLTAAQSDDIDGIHILSPNDDSVAYFDSYTFWGTDIGQNFKQPAKYRIRNWVDADWWKNGMGWADKGLDVLISAIKPIVVPIAQVNAVKNYYGYDINDFDEYFLKNIYGSAEEYNNSLYEVYVIFGQGYGTAMTAGDVKVPIEQWVYTGDYVGDGNSADYARWVASNKQLYNNMWKLSKYNAPEYDKYFTKFIDETDGVRHIKTAAAVLYYQQFLAIILGIIIVIKFPINFFQGEYTGETMGEKKRRKKERN